MVSVKSYITRFWQLVRTRPYVSLTIGALVLVSSVGTAVFAASNSSSEVGKPGTGSSVVAQNDNDPTKKVAAADSATKPVDSTETTTNTTVKTTQPAAKAAQTASAPAAGPKLLVVSPAAVTVKAGESFDGLTLRSNDGRAINMPGLSSMPAGAQMFLNFPAGPAKPSWSGSIITTRTTKPGTYTVELQGQADRTTYYRASLQVTVLPSPIMTVSVQQTGYDASQDAMVFNVRIERLYGYSKPIQSWYGQSLNSGTIQQLECPMFPVDDNNLTMYCRHVNGPRPGTGTISVNINPAGDSFNATAPFSLPPL
jgi:hypothetical protein